MSDEIRKLIKENWVFIGTQEEKELLERLSPNVKVEYQETMLRLETDYGLQKEFGICC